MKLNYKKISLEDIEGQKNNKNILQNYIAKQLGSFDPFTGLTVIGKEEYIIIKEIESDEESDSHISIDEYIENITSQTKAMNIDEKLNFLIERTVGTHERRHFLDCFCTPAGYKLLQHKTAANTLKLLMIHETIASIAPAVYPLESNSVEEIINKYAPNEIKDVTDNIKRMEYDLDIQLGSEPLIIIQGEYARDCDFLIVDIPLTEKKKQSIPCVTTVFLYNEKFHTILWPIGFSLLTECLAILTQGQYLLEFDPDLRIHFRQKLKEGFGTNNPYVPILAMLVRVFKSRSVNPHDNDIFRCVYRALFINQKDNKYTEKYGDHIGWNLIFVLENWVEISNDNEIKWIGPDFHENSNTTNSDSKTSEESANFLTFIKNNYLNKIIESTESARLEREGICVDDLFGATFIKTGQPPTPFAVFPNERVIVDNFKFYNYWLSNIIFTTILDELWTQPKRNICPIINKATRWMFPDPKKHPHSFCKKGIAHQNCGIWDRNSKYEGPECLWTKSMQYILTPQNKNKSEAANRLHSHWHSK